ncbi:MAG: hypothetical protein WKG07_49385 [Hymenobacter sp.]
MALTRKNTLANHYAEQANRNLILFITVAALLGLGFVASVPEAAVQPAAQAERRPEPRHGPRLRGYHSAGKQRRVWAGGVGFQQDAARAARVSQLHGGGIVDGPQPGIEHHQYLG